jgi:ribose transport system substrate-binding protein
MAAAFTTPVHADGEIIAVFTKNQTNPYFQTVRIGADIAAKALNAKTSHYIPTKPDSIPEQLSQIEDVVVKKPSAIVFIPVDYKAMVPGVEKINDAKIPAVNITDRSAGGKFLSFIGADDYSSGLRPGNQLDTLGGNYSLDCPSDSQDALILILCPGNHQPDRRLSGVMTRHR